MDKLWSPWRSAYIESFSKPKTDTNCIFCDPIPDSFSEDARSLVVAKNKFTFTILNLYPYNNGHLMVVPYRHISDFLALTQDEHIEVMKGLKQACSALKSVLKPEGFNIGANIGKAAGAGIDAHLHFHIVPRWNGDTNFMPALGEVKVLSQDLLLTKERIIANLPPLF